MCTLSWRHHPDGARGYDLLFNRDEQLSRESATAPALESANGIPYLSPKDGRAGGSWLLVNRFGTSSGLLNHYAAESKIADPEHTISRGALVLSMADCRDVAEFDARLAKLEPTGKYRPFLFFAIDPDSPLSLWRWDGDTLQKIAPPASRFMTTSSFQTEAVLAERQRHRQEFGSDPALTALRKLHLQHDPEQPAHSIRMRRPDAQTVSYSEIAVSSEGDVHFLYRPEPSQGLELLAEHHTSITSD
jgi:hypothetical protein